MGNSVTVRWDMNRPHSRYRAHGVTLLFSRKQVLHMLRSHDPLMLIYGEAMFRDVARSHQKLDEKSSKLSLTCLKLAKPTETFKPFVVSSKLSEQKLTVPVFDF